VVALPEDSDSEVDEIVDPDKMEIDDELKQYSHLKDTEEFRELMRLKKIQRRKQSRAREVYISADHTHDVVHFGFQCVSCMIEPIVGTRFHCMQCPAENAVDLCPKCHQAGSFTSESHLRSHRFQRIEQVEDDFFVDQDYAAPSSQYRRSVVASSSRAPDSEMSYLEDGFMPV
jgi:ZZ-type zinc finger-containing protein 3